MLVIYVVWGSTYLAIRFAVETMPPFLMAGSRFLLAGGMLYGWLRFRGAPRPSFADWRSALYLGAFLLVGGNGLVTWAEQWVTSGVAALIITTTPLWIMLFEWLLFGGARPRAVVWLGMALGFAGVTLLIEYEPDGEGSNHLWAIVALCGAPLLWSYGSLVAQRSRPLDPPLLTTALQMLCGGGLMFAIGMVMGEWRRFEPAAISARSWLSFAYLVLFGALLAFTTYMWLLRVAKPTVIATYAYVNPLVAVFLGAVIGGEELTTNIGLATAMIVGAVALITIRRRAETDSVVRSSPALDDAIDDASPDAPRPRLAECDG
jgi:drug/metabolite transporter (DMT)-like permease